MIRRPIERVGPLKSVLARGERISQEIVKEDECPETKSPRRDMPRCKGMSDIHKTIEAVWKIESTRLIAGIARVTRDVGIAEELAQDALVAALERWPDEGIPEKPAAWLMTAAKRRAI